MERAEGPSMVHEVLVSRFEHAPSFVIYDNACKAATCAVSRLPTFYQHTSFIVDRMHAYGHVNCNPCFDVGMYQRLHGVNT